MGTVKALEHLSRVSTDGAIFFRPYDKAIKLDPYDMQTQLKKKVDDRNPANQTHAIG